MVLGNGNSRLSQVLVWLSCSLDSLPLGMRGLILFTLLFLPNATAFAQVQPPKNGLMIFGRGSVAFTAEIVKQLTDLRNALVQYPQEQAVLLAVESGPYGDYEPYSLQRARLITDFMVNTYKIDRSRIITLVDQQGGDEGAVLYRVTRVVRGEDGPVCIPGLPPGSYRR